MASSNKVTAVHITLIFFVMLTIILGVVTYVFLNEGKDLRAEIQKQSQEANTQGANARQYLQQITEMKQMLGYDFADVGVADPNNPGTVLGAAAQEMRQNGDMLPGGVQPTISAHMKALRSEFDAAKKENTDLKAQVQSQQNEITALRGEYSNEVQRYSTAAANAERNLQDRITQQEEIVQDREAKITTLQNALAREQSDHDQVVQEYATYRDETEKSIATLNNTNDRLREKYEDATRLSFEHEDGHIVAVDNRTRLVWIDLGTADNLPERTTFSVYRKNHQGVGRGIEDIKGAIEVTRIVEPHLAEARILDASIYQPFAPGDPIYSPLWEVGRVEKFSVVGLIDLDEDGESDRDLFHLVVEASGAAIDNEVDDQGQRTPANARIDEQTKFLIIGHIPDPSTMTDPKDVEIAVDIIDHHKDMVQEAREQGVRRVTLHDFLSFMGYKARRRVFRPGEEQPYRLQAGSRRTAVSETIGGNRSSASERSASYGNHSRLKPPASQNGTNGNGSSGRGY